MSARLLSALVLVSLFLATAPVFARGRGSSSGGRSSYSSGSRSTSSSSRPSSTSSSSRPQTSPSARPSTGSTSGRSYSSSPTRGYSSSSRPTPAPAPSKGAQPRPTWTDPRGQARPIGAHAPQASRLHNSLAPARYQERPRRLGHAFGAYAHRPIVYYPDPYHPYFWPWLHDRSRRQRALWAYHHRPTMAPARYRDLLAGDAELEALLRELEAKGLERDPNFVPRDEAVWVHRGLLGKLFAAGPHGPLPLVACLFPEEEAALDLDLMFTDDFVNAAFNPQDEAPPVRDVPRPPPPAAEPSSWWEAFGGTCCGLVVLVAIGGGLLALARRQ